MRAIVTAVVAAIEAAAVAFAGLGAVAVPALLLWTVVFSLAAEPGAVLAGISGVWLLAHRVPMRIEVDAQTALGLGLAPEPIGFVLSLAPLGITLITALLAARAGWRFGGRGGTGAAGALGGALGFGAVALGAATLAAPLAVWPLWLAALAPAICYGAISLAAFAARAVRDEHDWWRACVRGVQRAVERGGAAAVAAVLPARVAEAMRLAGAGLAALVGLAALAFTAAVLIGYPHVIALTQGLHLDPLGSALVFLAHLALLPVAVIWSLSWITGAGFSIGAGSAATPFEALLGPLPALPLFGAIPQGWGSLGSLAPAALVLAGLALGVLFARRSPQRRASWTAALLTPVAAAALVGLAVAALCALASGSLGPGRLETTGASPWVAGGLAAGELGGGLLLGIVAARIDLRRIRTALPGAVRAVGERIPRPGSRTAADAGAPPTLEGAADEAGIPRSAARPQGDGGAARPQGDGAYSNLGEERRGRRPWSGWPGLRRSAPGSRGTGAEAGADAETVDLSDAAVDGAESRGSRDSAALARDDVKAALARDDVKAALARDDERPTPARDGGDAPVARGDGEPGARESAADAARGVDPDPASPDADELLRAYSWDRRQPEDEDPEPPRPGWRWGRRER